MNFIKNKHFKINLIENTKIFFFKHNILISGPRGIIIYNNLINYQNFTFFVSKTELSCFQNSKINKNKCKDSKNSLKLYNLLDTLINNVHYFFSKKLILVGVGMRAWIKYNQKEQKNLLLIKVGFSKDLYIEIPQNLIVFSLRPTLILIRGLNKEVVTLFSSSIKKLKQPDCYKGKGLQYKNEIISLKPGKKS
jgi:large subunit ribosomal protein L6